MAVFIFLKQIVDMLYQYQVLDYGMVLLALFLLIQRVYTQKIYKNIKYWMCGTDYIVMALMGAYLLSFIRCPDFYGIFFKVESCFLIYFLGRAYGTELMKYGKTAAVVGYALIYINLIYRFYQFGYTLILKGPAITLINEGGLYYYKTDMAIGMMIAVMFIYMFSEKKILKWITIIPIAGYMIFYSGARMEKFLFVIEYICIILCEVEQKTHFRMKWRNKGIQVLTVVGGVLIVGGFLLLQVFPFEKIMEQSNIDVGLGSTIENLMHSRQIIWWDILRYFSDQPLHIRLLGIDLGTEALHNAAGQRAHSTFIKTIYATGYVGCALWYGFVCALLKYVTHTEERKLTYMVLILWIMFLGAGLSIESMESTQMSWFPMLYAGALLSIREWKNGEIHEQEAKYCK